jgi:hypothetical protein
MFLSRHPQIDNHLLGFKQCVGAGGDAASAGDGEATPLVSLTAGENQVGDIHHISRQGE